MICWVTSCTSNKTYEDHQVYTEICCLDAGPHTLKCDDSGGDGWQGGFIEIQGTRYCEDFTGHRQENNVVVFYKGKYIL